MKLENSKKINNSLKKIDDSLEMANKYKETYNKLLNELPPWKKKAVIDSTKLKRTDDYLLNEFIKNVAYIAENGNNVNEKIKNEDDCEQNECESVQNS
jgi:hypothetical protein